MINTRAWRVGGGRIVLLALALAVAALSIDAQRGGAPAATLPLVRQVRTALAHGDVARARSLASTGTDQSSRELATAFVEIFEGKNADARTRLTPLANAAPLGEAALELGLLDVRTGHRADGERRLTPIADVRTFATPDDYLRVARAARGIREFLLANDAFQRVANEARADIQTEWGDLFLERHQVGDAFTNYQQALKLDPQWIPAAVGLFRAGSDDQPEIAQKVFDAARKLAPDYPDIWIATAEDRLEDGDLPATKDALDHLAKVRPDTIDEASLRAALAYKEHGMAAVDAAVAHVRDIDPTSPAGYRAAGEQAERDYRFDDAAELARKATAIDGDDPVSHFDLGLDLLRTGDEKGARVALERSWALDKSSQVTKNLLTLLDHLDTFVVVPHNDFIFKFAKNEADVLKAYALPLADEAYRQYTERYGFKPQGPLLVEVFPVHDDFAVRTLGLPGLVGALGSCFGRVVSLDSPSARPPGDFSWQATLWHELAHVFTLQLSQYRVPRWLTEGISVYEEYRRQPAWGRELTLEFARDLGEGKTFGVKKLPQAFKDPKTLSMAYFEASLVVEHLVKTNGEAGLRTLLLAYAGGATDAEAFVKAYGRNIDDVEASYNQFIEQRYGALRDAMRDPPREVADDDIPGLRARAEAAPGNFESQFSYGQALVRASDLAGARAPLERAAALAPEASGDGSPHGLLSRIAEAGGDTTKARKELRDLLRYDHTNVSAARHLAELAAAANATDDEDYALQLVADLDPFDANTHVTLGRRLMAKGDTARALIEFQANLALGPTNLAEAHSDVGEALLKLGRKDDARREALAALKEAPTFARAQDLLLAVSAR